ncbi:PA2169 family four-helix-bundle protein [Cupriavidus oxalaticus]|uniref:PA2169 family four-helix-bundle protein n=1 Tax=Cupriavidus oxalaticus TaxID=96344 RepID=UPI003F73711D
MAETQQQRSVVALNQLIAAGKDSELACTSGATNVHDAQLRDILVSTAESCRGSVRELQSMVSAMGGDPAERGSMQGTLFRGWMALRHMLQPNNDDAILGMCEHEEEAARREYQSVMMKPLPPEASAMLQRQYDELMQHHGRIHAMRGMQIH